MSGYVCGTAVCPLCGEKHMMRAASRDDSGYPKTVVCCGCHGEWGPWPSAAEFLERARQRARDKSKRWRLAHPEEHRARVRQWCREHRKRKDEFAYEWATCPTCGEEFIKNVHNQIYCCRHCANTRPERRAYMREYWRKHHAKVVTA